MLIPSEEANLYKASMIPVLSSRKRLESLFFKSSKYLRLGILEVITDKAAGVLESSFEEAWCGLDV